MRDSPAHSILNSFMSTNSQQLLQQIEVVVGAAGILTGKGLAGQIGELDTYSAGYVRILEYKSTLKVNGTVATGGQAEVPL